MPKLSWRLSEFTPSGENGVVSDGRAVLRPRDLLGRYDPDGTLQEEVFLSTTIPCQQLDSFFGFCCQRLDSLSGGVGFQLSTDGSTFLSWDGLDWTEDLSRFSTADELEEFIGSFPVPFEPSLTLKMRLQPVAGQSPIVSEIFFFVELTDKSRLFSFEEDFDRSFRRTIESRLRVPFRDQTASTGTDQLAVPSRLQVITQIDGVWNPALDPNLSANLFSSFSGRTITLTSAVPTGANLLVQGEGRPEVILGAEAEYKVSSLPFVFFEMLDDDENKALRSAQVAEINLALKVARVRWHPARRRVTGLVRCSAAHRKESKRFADAMKVAFERDPLFRSLGSGQLIQILDFTPIGPSDKIMDGLYERVVSVQAEGWDYVDRQGYEEIPLVQLVRAGFGSLTARCCEIEVSS